jgi:prevent-host-death family protein
MVDCQINIGRVKRDISELVNRVAYGGERIVLTSRGKPKAALVSLEDYHKLVELTGEARLSRWNLWLAESDKLADEILDRREGTPLDVDALWHAARAELENRDDQTTSD